MEKIYLNRCTEASARTSIDSEIKSGSLKKGIVYEEYKNGTYNPLVYFINNPVASTGLKLGSEVGGLDRQHRPIEVDGTANPKVGLYEAGSNKMVPGTARTTLGSVLSAKMKNRMSAGHQSTFQTTFNNMMAGGSSTSNNAFAYLRSNLMNTYPV